MEDFLKRLKIIDSIVRLKKFSLCHVSASKYDYATTKILQQKKKCSSFVKFSNRVFRIEFGTIGTKLSTGCGIHISKLESAKKRVREGDKDMLPLNVLTGRNGWRYTARAVEAAEIYRWYRTIERAAVAVYRREASADFTSRGVHVYLHDEDNKLPANL